MSVRPFPVKYLQSMSWVDLLFVSLLAVFAYGLIGVASEWVGPYHSSVQIDLGFRSLPRYAFFSLIRGFVAYGLSLSFTIAVGYLAAHSRTAEKVIVPLIDILQSIPVLGFLPGLVLALVSIFPTSNIGLELACIVMIFTGQVWNMIFSFYSSVRNIPTQYRDLAALYRLNRLEVLKRVELPSALNGLLWNSMVSMAGGWFFLMVVESFTLGGQKFRVPGIGSYMATAMEQRDSAAIVGGILAMFFVIVLVDRCLWAPLVYWSHRVFVESNIAEPKPLVSRWLSRSTLLRDTLRERQRWQTFTENKIAPVAQKSSVWMRSFLPGFRKVILVLSIAVSLWLFIHAVQSLFSLLSQTPARAWLDNARECVFTFLRVIGAVFLGSLWAIPVGVWIGTHPKWTIRLQPIVQILASFPAPMIFPVVMYVLLKIGLGIEVGSMFLMTIGSQWYILFNVIAGATVIPTTVKDLAASYRIRGFQLWKLVLFPSIFPYLLAGWVTAAGGAWNASIVSEYVFFGEQTYTASGIGAAISLAAQNADFPNLACGIVSMILMLILINRLFWARLFKLSESRYQMLS